MRLPEELEALDEQCFADSGLEKIVVPASVRDIGYSAFEDCKNLREVRFAPGSQLERVEHRVFAGSRLRAFAAPQALRYIGENAFYNCASLQTVRLNEGLEEVGRLAFARTGLREVRVPGSVRALHFSAFHLCHLDKLGLPARLRPFRALGCFARVVEELVVPAEVEEIPDEAFKGQRLKSVVFAEGSRLKRIGRWAF